LRPCCKRRGHSAAPSIISGCTSHSATNSLIGINSAVDLVQIKGLWIKCATNPVHHLLMLGVLRVLYSLQKARVPPDTPAILGWTGAFACEAHRVALPRFVGEHLFHKQLVVPAIAK